MSQALQESMMRITGTRVADLFSPAECNAIANWIAAQLEPTPASAADPIEAPKKQDNPAMRHRILPLPATAAEAVHRGIVRAVRERRAEIARHEGSERWKAEMRRSIG
jgi:hypothetical protein